MKLSELFGICNDWHDYQTVGHDVNYKFKEEGDHLYIYFQGSSSTWDWVRNFMFGKRPYKDMKIPYRVHRGFLRAWKEVEDIIIDKITERENFGAWKYKWNDITVVGYSHGGALCTFATECVWFYRPDLRESGLHGYAFEAPRIFAQWRLPKELAKRWENLLVIRTNNDIVTHCPPVIFGYRNLGSLLKVKGDTSLVTEWYIPKCVKSHYPQVVMDALLKYEEANLPNE